MASSFAHIPLPRGRPTCYAERYEMLDAWRGLAALAVVVHHVSPWYIGGPAVMVFFVISGYCIAAASDACQRRNMGFKQFMLRRIRRIYPPYLLSILFWFLTRLIKLWHTGVNDLDRPWTDWLQNLTLTQWVSLLFHPQNLAAENKTLFVAAYWSLGYEEQFYLVFAIMMILASVFGLSIRATVGALIALSVAWIACFPVISYGVFIEYWAMFGVGALVFYRLCRTTSLPRRRLIEASIVLIFAFAAFKRWFAGMHWGVPATIFFEQRIGWNELVVAAGFAGILLLLRPLDSTYARARWLSVPLGALGTITYSLYLVHQFNLTFVSTVVEGALRIVHAPEPPLAVLVALYCLGHIMLASVFWYFCERPFLNRSLTPPAAASSPPPIAALAQPGR